MRMFIFLTLVTCLSTNALAQTRTTGNTGTGGTTGQFGTGQQTGGLTGGSAAGSAGFGSLQTSNMASQFGQGFNFNPAFSSAGLRSPFGNNVGMMGMGGRGMMGMGGLGMGGFGMGMGGMGMGGMGGRNQQGNRGSGMGGNQQPSLRPTVKLGFETVLPSNNQRQQQVQVSMSRIPQADKFMGANVQIQGRKATVSGSVPPDKVRVLKQLLLLEPGIYEVDLSQVNKGSASSAAAGEQVPAPLPQ